MGWEFFSLGCFIKKMVSEGGDSRSAKSGHVLRLRLLGANLSKDVMQVAFVTNADTRTSSSSREQHELKITPNEVDEFGEVEAVPAESVRH
ncbi:hypothetical protein [Piscibacillus sp. B03]|uniref:hypothetical protein n=1 Tax=Piscibacillus sp. B03 TaxID=3457430 RepID=UPI003FCE2E06